MKVVMKESDIDDMTQRLGVEATRLGMEVLCVGNCKAWTNDMGKGIIISPDPGSEPLSLIFKPYSAALKKEIHEEGSRHNTIEKPTKEKLEGVRDYHVTDSPIVEVRGGFGGFRAGDKPWKGVILEERSGGDYVGDYYVGSLTGGSASAVQAYQVSRFDKNGKPFGTKKVYHWFRPSWSVELDEAFQPGTAILVGPRFTKTEYSEDKIKAHLGVIQMLDILKDEYGAKLDVYDEGHYWETRDPQKLAQNFGVSAAMIQSMTGILKKAVEGTGLTVGEPGTPIPSGEPAEEPPIIGYSKDVKPAQKTLKEFTKRRPGGDIDVVRYRRRVK